jgi:hypothetical protein
MITGNYDLMGDIHGHAAGQHLLRERGAFGMKLYFGPNTDKPVTAALDVQGYLEEDKSISIGIGTAWLRPQNPGFAPKAASQSQSQRSWVPTI